MFFLLSFKGIESIWESLFSSSVACLCLDSVFEYFLGCWHKKICSRLTLIFPCSVSESSHFSKGLWVLVKSNLGTWCSTARGRCRFAESEANILSWPKVSFLFFFLSQNERHIFQFHQELYWTVYSSFCSTTFCHFSGNLIIPSSKNLSFWADSCSGYLLQSSRKMTFFQLNM